MNHWKRDAIRLVVWIFAMLGLCGVVALLLLILV